MMDFGIFLSIKPNFVRIIESGKKIMNLENINLKKILIKYMFMNPIQLVC